MSVADLIDLALEVYMSQHAPYAWPERDLNNYLVNEGEDATPAGWVAQWVAKAVLELLETRPSELSVLATRWEKGDWTEPEEDPIRILADLILQKLRGYR